MEERLIQTSEPVGLEIRLARTAAEVTAAQRLRYEVFAEEMGARLASAALGLDRDDFDRHCDHLIVRAGADVVGTYRMLAPQGRRRAGGWYCASEFDVGGLERFAEHTVRAAAPASIPPIAPSTPSRPRGRASLLTSRDPAHAS